MTLKFPFVTEKAMVLLENQSKLQFLVTNEALPQASLKSSFAAVVIPLRGPSR